jgi:ribonuclease J
MEFSKDELYFIPLGGAEQFGVNLNVYGYGGKWLAVDCGIGFADEKFPGIDILLPDPAFIEERKKNLVGLIITHAHEDHIGAVAYLWPRLRCPVYCTPFTAAILTEKAKENPECRDLEITIVRHDRPITAGPFGITFIPVTHSVPETRALLIETAAGRVLHTGDWNLDPAPVLGKATDPEIFKLMGDQGLLAYIGDSTNAEVDGVSGSEREVEIGLTEVFRLCEGRIAVTMFASNVGRIRSICKAAKACGRNVCVVGRSLHRMIGAANDCGYMDGIDDFVPEDDVDLIPPERILYIATGSQGEARAQIARIARAEHPIIKMGKGDTAIFSARPIPGNEKEINLVKNNFVAAGVKVITHRDTPHTIHVSGHPAREELTKMIQWTRPQVVIPVHGERAMLEAHAEIARSCQVKTTIVPNNGSVIRLAPGEPKVVDHVPTGLLAVEPGRIINANHEAITQRRKLQFSGTVHVSMVMNARGDLLADPQVTTVGLIDPEERSGKNFEIEILNEIEDILSDMTREELYDDKFVAEEIRIGIRRFAQHKFSLKPKTTVHLVRL